MRKVGGLAISAQVKDTDETHAEAPRKRWFKRWWALGLWGFLGLIMILFTLGLWAWTQRYDLLESRIIDILAEAGFQAELDVISVTRTQGQIKNIRLHQGGQEILDIEQIQAEYIWPDIRDLKFKVISIEGATARLNLGDDWLPTESWAREPFTNSASTESKPNFPFPEDGVKLTDATIILSSPLGEAKFYMDAESTGENTFKSDITLAPSDLSYGGYSAQGAGFVSLEMSGNNLSITGQAQTGTLSNGKVNFTDADVQVDGIFDLAEMEFMGSTSLQSGSASSELYASGPARIAWDGTFSSKEQTRASGNWMISAEKARSPRSARAQDVAETLSLYPVISVVPVTEYYAPHMRDVVFDFLTGSNISGQGQLNYGPEGFSVNPVGTFLVETDNNRLRLQPRPDKNFYQFDKGSEQITAHMDAAFEKPVGLTLDNIHFTAASDNGLRLNGVSGFSTQIATQADWQAVDSSQRPVRLDPLTAAFRYDATDNPRRLSVTTAFTYDGELPGSYVESLTLDGRFDVRLYDGRQVVDFTPRGESLVTLKSLETPTSWRGEMIQFTLPPTKELFTRTAKQSTFAALLNAADFTLTRPATDGAGHQVLDLSAAMMDVTGTLYPDAVQDWAIDFTQSEYSSETLPGPGTSAAVEKASLTARLAQGQEPQITLASPSITVETPLIQASNIQFEMQGTPDKYTAEHTGGTIFITGSEFAERARRAGLGSFPANGSVNFSDGGFTGQANLRVAKANDAAVNVDYTFRDGAGTADISVPSILFEPKGLQPQTLLPALSGKIARVTGEARANLKVGFAEGALTQSSGTLDLIDIGVGTAPGPITGLNTKMRFASLSPLETAGPQTLSLESFNPGFPLENGSMTFNFVPEGVKVDAADWPIGNGSFSLDPFTWVYAADENRVTMRVKNIAVSDFLENMGNQKIRATGNVVGTFPVVVRGLDVLVENGEISVPDGGEIRYDPGPGVQSYSEAESIQVLRERRSQEYAAIAQDALREFKYRELSASLDGPLNGDVEIGLVFDGSNQKVLNQQPFRFDISVKGELFNIARSFDSNAQVKSEILRQNGKLPDGAIIGE